MSTATTTQPTPSPAPTAAQAPSAPTPTTAEVFDPIIRDFLNPNLSLQDIAARHSTPVIQLVEYVKSTFFQTTINTIIAAIDDRAHLLARAGIHQVVQSQFQALHEATQLAAAQPINFHTTPAQLTLRNRIREQATKAGTVLLKLAKSPHDAELPRTTTASGVTTVPRATTVPTGQSCAESPNRAHSPAPTTTPQPSSRTPSTNTSTSTPTTESSHNDLTPPTDLDPFEELEDFNTNFTTSDFDLDPQDSNESTNTTTPETSDHPSDVPIPDTNLDLESEPPTLMAAAGSSSPNLPKTVPRAA